MRRLISVVFLMVLPSMIWAADGAVSEASEVIRPAGDATLDDFQWVKRPVIVFADSPSDPRFADQMRRIERGLDDLDIRDVVVLVDTDPDARNPLRQKLRPRGFMLVIVSKDGKIAARKPFPWSAREISASIDKMPIRKEELRERRGIGGS